MGGWVVRGPGAHHFNELTAALRLREERERLHVEEDVQFGRTWWEPEPERHVQRGPFRTIEPDGLSYFIVLLLQCLPEGRAGVFPVPLAIDDIRHPPVGVLLQRFKEGLQFTR
jgi:hypothetical protein